MALTPVTLTPAEFGIRVDLHVGQTLELWESNETAMAFDCVMKPDNVLQFVVYPRSPAGDTRLSWTALRPGQTEVLVRRYELPPFIWLSEPEGSVTVVVSR